MYNERAEHACYNSLSFTLLFDSKSISLFPNNLIMEAKKLLHLLHFFGSFR